MDHSFHDAKYLWMYLKIYFHHLKENLLDCGRIYIKYRQL